MREKESPFFPSIPLVSYLCMAPIHTITVSERMKIKIVKKGGERREKDPALKTEKKIQKKVE